MTNKTDGRSGLFVQMSVIRANELSVEPSFTNRTQLLSYIGILWKFCGNFVENKTGSNV